VSGRIEFVDEIGPGARAVIGLASLLPFIAVYDLIVRPWPFGLTLVGLPFTLIGCLAGVIGAVGLGLALLGPRRRVVIDAVARQVREETETAVGTRWVRCIPFDDIRSVLVGEERQTDGPNEHVVVLDAPSKRVTLVVARSTDTTVADMEAERIRGLLRSA
jgi:hypothetical protein